MRPRSSRDSPRTRRWQRTDPAGRDLLRRAADLYETAAKQFGRFFTCINATTLRLLAGDVDRARELANEARRLVATDRASGSTDDYWQEATEAEAALIIGDIDAAAAALRVAVQIAGENYAAMAVTRRQLRLVCEAIGTDPGALDALTPPLVLYYSGHLIDETQRPSRFPPDLESDVEQQIRAFVAERRIGFAYGSLASGADILVAEAVLDAGIRLEIVLPFDTDEFEAVSVAPAGASWAERFRSCLAARRVGRARIGLVVHARRRALRVRRTDRDGSHARPRRLPRRAGRAAGDLDGDPAGGVAGTAHDVALWSAAGHPTHVISLPASSRQPRDAAAGNAGPNREIGTIVFTDLHGFSRLRDEQFTTYVGEVLAALGAVIDGTPMPCAG